ncbi:MAG: DUF3244 domain-containing protein [Bacteroidales bacterium]|nr:DUF3244 domain-containing protein [Bacteroidales bacterium]
MKKILFLIVLSLTIGFGNTRANAQSNDNGSAIEIVIDNNGSVSQLPRTPIPISGYVYENEIFLFFSNDLGDVSIRLEDSLGCTVLSTTVDSSNGSESLPFSGLPDSYTIYFTLEDNTSYIGRFELL